MALLPARTRVLIADDSPSVRRILWLLLSGDGGLSIIRAGCSLDELGAGLARDRVDVLVIDPHLSTGPGVELIAWVRRVAPDTAIVVLTTQRNPAFLTRVRAAGAPGYVLKDCADSELASAVHTVAAGGEYLSSALGRSVSAAPR